MKQTAYKATESFYYCVTAAKHSLVLRKFLGKFKFQELNFISNVMNCTCLAVPKLNQGFSVIAEHPTGKTFCQPILAGVLFAWNSHGNDSELLTWDRRTDDNIAEPYDVFTIWNYCLFYI